MSNEELRPLAKPEAKSVDDDPGMPQAATPAADAPNVDHETSQPSSSDGEQGEAEPKEP